MSLFDQFVQQYQLSKTLRFELKPVGETSELLEEEKVFRKDKALQENYEKTKPYLDRLHRAFVKEALAKEKGTFTEKELKEYAELCQKFQAAKEHKVKKDKTELAKKEKELRQKITQSFEQQAQAWAEKYSLNSKKESKKKDQKALSILFGVEVFKILQARYGEEEGTKIRDPSTGEQISLFAAWQKFSGYFTKFQETRKNFYKNDGKASAIATRTIDQNLKRFCNNRVVFEKSLKGLDFSEVEKNFGKSLEQVFALDFYNHCLLQEGIDEYNQILGGGTLANGEKRKGLNELINKYNQDQKDQKDQKRPYLRKLDKQILSEQEKLIGEIENEEELLAELKDFHQTAAAKTKSLKRLLPDFFKHNATYDIAKIYITKEALNTIAYRWTDEAPLLQQSLGEVLKQEKIVNSADKLPDCIALKHLKEALKQVAEKEKKIWKERYSEIGIFKNENAKEADLLWQQFLEIFQYEFQALFERAISKKEKVGYQVFEKEFQALWQNFKITKESKDLIKNFADQVLAIYQMAKYFAVEKKRQWSEDYDLGDFYTDPHKGYFEHFYQRAYEEIVQPYNRIRNYLTKKPYEEKKWKLNFENATLAAGWDQNKEPEKWAVLLRQEEKLFLGIMKKGCNQIFAEKKIKNLAPGSGQDKYEKMVYKYLPDPVKMLPKVCFCTKGKEFFKPPAEILEIYKEGKFKKGENFSVPSLQKLIDFYKDCLKKYPDWQCYDFRHLKPTEKYQNLKEFTEDVAKDSYKIKFQALPAEYIRDKNQQGELYLFQIKNKDWNKGATGCKNLHTLYFEALFAPANQKQNFPFKLNGEAEIFYRPATEQAKLGSKKDRQGKRITNHKRFSEEKIFFHLPVTLNRAQSQPNWQFNAEMNNFLAQNGKEIKIIGLDRGEKHLLYYTVINQEGEVLTTAEGKLLAGSLNWIGRDGAGQVIDYHAKLGEREKEREKARQAWEAVQQIKDLKKGYISQVVRKLADLALQYNAIIVLEDLNMRFKQMRGGIEKSVYQQLEKALITKFNFLVNKKETDSQKPGHPLRAYQLTAPFKSFQAMGKQTGLIFYTPAAYTSQIDPVTGWRPNLYLKYQSAKKAQEKIGKFSSIEFREGRFEFTYDLKKFKKLKEWPKKTRWTVCSKVARFQWVRQRKEKEGGYKAYPDLTENFQELFKDYGLDYRQGDLQAQIKDLTLQGNEKFFKRFFSLFKLLCQIRNTDEKAKDPNQRDFILSPVAPFFDSRKGKHPRNGDENGAYNIARKGCLILAKIAKFYKEKGDCTKLKWGDFFISHKDWDDFTQKEV